jgi:hypothetical protein
VRNRRCEHRPRADTGRGLPGGHRHEREDALTNAHEQIVGRMVRSKADDELPCVRHDLTRQRDEMQADRFHAPRGPFRSQDQALHRGIEVHNEVAMFQKR